MTPYKNRNFLYLIILVSGLSCRQIYTPPNTGAGNNFLVVDGIIISGNDSTIINLSRAQPLSDSIYYFMPIPETGASMSLAGSGGDSYNLTENSPGSYSISQLVLNNSETYKLKIRTGNGEVYLSDSIPIKQTPPIDSVSWQLQNDGVHIYVNTHDPLNNTRYYRWKYSQTYQYRSAFGSEYLYQNGNVILRDSNQNVFNCWQSSQSTSLLLGSSANLVSDIISMQPINFISYGSEDLGVTYSILVEQFAITSASYSFWQLLLQNTEQLGTLFDPQPTQLPGNIHCITNPNEPVLGYLSAAILQEERIYIHNSDLQTWGYSPIAGCSLYLVPPDSFAFYYNIGFIPVSQNPPPVGGYYSAINTCVDCTLQGGTNVKPSFWPN
jgi:hypothetical protein